MADDFRAGVVGVGTMGQHHARVYSDLATAELVGVHDAHTERAETTAAKYDTRSLPFADLLDAVDVVSVAVPTEYHYRVVRECIDAGVDVLVEKPFVMDVSRGRKLIAFADERDVTLQVGHIERFNPAIQKLLQLLPELDVIAVEARRLGPQPERDIAESAVMDLMVHDIDVLLQMVGPVTSVTADRTHGGEYVTATVRTEAGELGRLTASRVTEEKIRELSITASDCHLKVDYTDQSLEICRQSIPEYVRTSDSVHYRHENVVEEVKVQYREPLKNELEAFLEAVATGEEPPVTGEDGLRAVEIARTIDEMATKSSGETRVGHSPVQH